MFSKFTSRKFLIVLVTAVLDVLVASGQITTEIKELLLTLITGLAGLYITVEGLRDIIMQIKGKITI